ncbi:MAG: N-acetylmuramoyl-L-alanine amidase [Nitrospirota bacterium]
MAQRFLLSLILIICLSMASAVFAQPQSEVLLRFSERDKSLRIVFESEETFINGAKIITSPSQIEIEFPLPFILTAKDKLPFGIVADGNLLMINLKEEGETRVFRLTDPPRLVLDIMTKEKRPAQIASKVFVIDPGHGGYDNGITFKDINEKNLSLRLAKDFDKVLTKKGKKVFLTRKVDYFVSLTDRIFFVNQKEPDIFISLHASMSDKFVLYSPKFKGHDLEDEIDFFSSASLQKKYIKRSKILSESIENTLEDEFGIDVIYRHMPLPILNSVSAPCVLIELPSSEFLVYDQELRTRIINAIVNGIILYEQSE